MSASNCLLFKYFKHFQNWIILFQTFSSGIRSETVKVGGRNFTSDKFFSRIVQRRRKISDRGNLSLLFPSLPETLDQQPSLVQLVSQSTFQTLHSLQQLRKYRHKFTGTTLESRGRRIYPSSLRLCFGDSG